MSLEAAAGFLGEPYGIRRVDGWGAEFIAKRGITVLDDELCMALLRRAVEFQANTTPVLWYGNDRWYFKFWPKGRDVYYEYTVVEEGPTPLAAVLAAVQALEAA